MADPLSAQERAAIEAAVAAGRVTVVPRGVSGLPALRWVEGQLLRVHADGSRLTEAEARRLWGKNGAASARREPDPRIVARRDRVAALWREGLTVPRIAAELGATVNVVTSDVALLQREGVIARRLPVRVRS